MMITRVYHVPDVSCEHCVRAITTALQQLDGIRQVQVDLVTKQVTVEADDRVSDEQIRAGIEDAGYTVAG
jgi:copper ion binding protein